MKLITALCLLCVSYSAYTFEQKTNGKHSSLYSSSSLLPEFNLTLHQQGFEKVSILTYGSVELKTNYSSSNTQRAPAVVSIQEQNSDFYLHSELTIHSSNDFDLSMSANIYQKNVLSIDLLSNYSTAHNNIHMNSLPYENISSTQLEPQYSLIGNYSISSHWKLSGGILFTDFSNIWDNDNSNVKNNNVALVQTSYRF